jgi:hypothetical protein
LEVIITGEKKGDAKEIEVETAIQHYFSYKAQISKRELIHLLKTARTSLFIGLIFLSACIFASSLVTGTGHFNEIFKESLFIVGWVAMWRPLEMFLYDWWPVRRLQKIYERLSEMDVKVEYISPKSMPIKI